MFLKKLKNLRLVGPLAVPLALLSIFTAAVSIVFLLRFPPGTWSKAEDFSVLGSYVGGLLGPAISLVALMALLKTVKLQMEQNASIASDAQRASVTSYKQSQMQLLDQQILMYERIIDRYNKEGEQLLRLSNANNPSLSQGIRDVDIKIGQAEEEIAGLIKLSVNLSLSEFDSVEMVRAVIKKGLLSANPHLYG